jgi:hypothetical protein
MGRPHPGALVKGLSEPYPHPLGVKISPKSGPRFEPADTVGSGPGLRLPTSPSNPLWLLQQLSIGTRATRADRMRGDPFQKGISSPQPQTLNERFVDNESGSCDISGHAAILHKTGNGRSCDTKLAALVTRWILANFCDG